jgi:hypothetical protein
LAFLLLKRGDSTGAAEHLERFLARPPQSPEAERWVRHATQTLAEIRGESAPGAPGAPGAGGTGAAGHPGGQPPAPRG